MTKNPRVERLNNLFVDLFCKEGLKFALVDTDSFQAFVHALDPRYKQPERHKLSTKLVPVKYETVKKDVVKCLEAASSRASFTTDAWTSVNNDAYTGVTVHYVDSD